MNLLDRFAALGVRLRLDGTRAVALLPAKASPDLRAELVASKDQLLAELLAQEERRRRVLTLLTERPGCRYGVIYDPDASPEYDVLIVAVPGASCEVRVPKPSDSWDFMSKLMRAVEALPRRDRGVRA